MRGGGAARKKKRTARSAVRIRLLSKFLVGKRLVNLDPVVHSHNRAFMNRLVSVFFDRYVIVAGFYLDFQRGGLLQRCAVDRDLRALGLGLDLNPRHALRRAASPKDLADAAAHEPDIVGAAGRHQAGRVVDRLAGEQLEFGCGVKKALLANKNALRPRLDEKLYRG